MKELWGYVSFQLFAPMKYYYKADFGAHSQNKLKWRSPVTMPPEAIRWDDVEFETTVKRVQDLTEGEIYSVLLGGDIPEYTSGFALLNDIRDYWNALHAKPVKEGDGYGYVVYYPYDHTYHIDYTIPKDSDNSNYALFYKGKPLTIYPNPYIEVIRGKR